MSQAVAAAFGYGLTRISESFPCECGGHVGRHDCVTDNIGRVISVCPDCGKRHPITGHSAVTESERVKAALHVAKAARQLKEQKARKLYGEAICKFAGCRKRFVRLTRVQKLCSRSCATAFVTARRFGK